MSERLGCGAPPTKYPNGTCTTCCEPGRRWTASKDGKEGEVIRCEKHAADLRRKGYEVHIAGKSPKDKAPWDMTTTHSLEAGAGWLRKNSGALLVFVMRANDAVLVVDQGIAAGDVLGMLEVGLPEAMQRLEEQQAQSVA